MTDAALERLRRICLAFPETTERLRARVEGLRLQHEGSPIGEVATISVGAAAAIAHASYSSDALIRAADDALLNARLDGGNRVVSAPPVTI